ncbi:FAD-binding protein [Paenibacillus sp. P26]|nr:FAD-binding protein [Paenibacillus sp. P26]UUZ95418.1 FAD-binding protein [Paenibacillus sp. P25]
MGAKAEGTLPNSLRGHSYEAFSLIDAGLIIDVSGLQQLHIDKTSGIAHIGAGFRSLPLYEALWKEGLTIPAGTCATVGLSGLALGGGYGYLSRLMGMTCDNVLGVELIDAQGRRIRADAREHSDLLWACRGGGDGSFGVITSFTFRVHPIRDVTRFKLTWPFADLKKVVKYWQHWAPHTDDRLTSSLVIPAKHHGVMEAGGVFAGSEQELRSLLRPFLAVAPPLAVSVRTSSWIEAARLQSVPDAKPVKFKNTSAYAYEPLPEAALDTLIRNLERVPGHSNFVMFDAYGERYAGCRSANRRSRTAGLCS